MRWLLILIFLGSGCGKEPPSPPAPPPAAPVPPAPPLPVAPPSAVDPESPLQGADLTALGFPKDVQVRRFGANPRNKEYQCISETHHTLLFFAVESYESEGEAAAAYKNRRDSRAAAEAGLKDEGKYGQKGYVAGAEVVFLKGKTVVVVRAGRHQEREVKPEDLEKVVRGAAERLSR